MADTAFDLLNRNALGAIGSMGAGGAAAPIVAYGLGLILADTKGWFGGQDTGGFWNNMIAGASHLSKSQPNFIAKGASQIWEDLSKMNKEGMSQLASAGDHLVAPLPTPGHDGGGGGIDLA